METERLSIRDLYLRDRAHAAPSLPNGSHMNLVPLERQDLDSSPQTTPATDRHGGPSGRLFAVLAMATALFASGAAGLVNQVVWQRALRVFLGGSETICSMIVVL